MRFTIYYNNLPFTSKNITNGLYKFWMTKIVDHKNKKIWLTIDINLTNNTTFQLIKKLPFNTSDYGDVLIVAEDKLRSNLLYSKADQLDSITFTYNLKDKQPNTSWNKDIYIYTFILSIFVLFSTLFLIRYYIVISNQPTLVIEVSNEVFVNNKLSKDQFSSIIDLFKSNSSHLYFPSHFLPSNFYAEVICDKEPVGSFTVELVRNKQYETLNYLTQITIEHIATMQRITKEYSDIITNYTT